MSTIASEVQRTLIVAHGADERAVLRRALERGGPSWVVLDEGDPDRALVRATTEAFDCVIIEHRPVTTGVELVRAIRERAPNLPLLLVAGALDEELERAVVEAGATDVISHDDASPTRLARRVRAAVRIGRVDAEQARMLAEAQAAAAARDDLLAVVSHDLRSPLNAIVLACDALEGIHGDAPDQRRYIGAIRRASQRAERLLRDLLDVARIESGGLRLECRPVSAKAILDQTRSDHEIVARDAGAQLVVDITADPGQVFADRDRILQVLANLVGNSIKHAAGAPIRLEARADADGVELVVADRGPGIVPDQLPHIFYRFWQGRSKRRGGAGLGLTIAKGIVEAHGGQIEVTSEVGQGTRFTVRLPRPPTRT
jgi:signal transduction histidine kinase